MSRTFHDGSRRIRVRGVRRAEPDLRKLGLALLDIVQAEAEAEAERQHKDKDKDKDSEAAEVVELRPQSSKPERPEKDAA